jgi:hypothetical protein
VDTRFEVVEQRRDEEYAVVPVDKDGNSLSADYKLTSEQAAALRWAANSSNEFSGSTIQA